VGHRFPTVISIDLNKLICYKNIDNEQPNISET